MLLNFRQQIKEILTKNANGAARLVILLAFGFENSPKIHLAPSETPLGCTFANHYAI